MAVEVERLETTLRAPDHLLRQDLANAQRLTRDYAGKMDSILSGVGQGFGKSGFLDSLSNISNVISALPAVGTIASALVRPLTDAARAGVMFNATWESAREGFTGIIGDSDRALQHLNRLQQFAERTPFEFTGLLKSSRYMTTFGFQITEHIPKLTAWGNAIAATGDISEDVLQGVVRAFGQMTAKGRVSAEEMEQLAERGIPSWELLAKAIGKSVEETRRLSEMGRLKGRESMEAITAMMEIDPRYQNQMAIQSRTLLGLMSNAEDLKARSLGMATRTMTTDIKASLEAALSQAGTAEAIASSINAGIAPVSGLVKAAATGLLGGGITAGLAEGIKAGRDIVTSSISELGLGAISTFAGVVGIQSPSKVFYDFGLLIGEGLSLGLQEGMTKVVSRSGDTFTKLAERFKVPVESLMQANAELVRQLSELDDRLPSTIADIPVGSQINIPSGSSGRRNKPSRRGAGVERWEGLIQRYAPEYGVDPNIIRAMMWQESSGDPSVTSNKGARGLMQLIPATARAYGLRVGDGIDERTDPAKNLQAGIHYFADLLKEFGGDVRLALAGYNAGAGAVHKYGGIPPYAETQNYVRSITGRISAMSGMSGLVAQQNPDEWTSELKPEVREFAKWLYERWKRGGGTRNINDLPGFNQVGAMEADTRATRERAESFGLSEAAQRAVQDFVGRRLEYERQHPVPVVVVGGDISGGVGSHSGSPFDFSNISDEKARGVLSFFTDGTLETSSAPLQTILNFHRELTNEVGNVGAAYEQTKPGIGEWYKMAAGGGIEVYKSLKQIESAIPPLEEQFKGIVVDAPKSIGSIFGDAVREWDGTVKGFGRSLAVGAAEAMREASAQMIENVVTQGASKILQSIFKPSEKDVVAALDKSFMFTPLQEGFGVNSAAVTVNTTSTDLNTLALNQNTAALQSQAAMAGASGGGGGGGILGSIIGGIVNAFIPGLGSLFSGGGSFSTSVGGWSTGGGEVSTGLEGFNPSLAVGAMLMPKAGGHLVRVAEGGFAEVVLSTDPKYKARTSNLLSQFLDRADFIPKFEKGGWSDGMDTDLRGGIPRIFDKSSHSYAPDFSHTTNYNAPAKQPIHLHYHEPPPRRGRYDNYKQPMGKREAMEHFFKNIEKYVNR